MYWENQFCNFEGNLVYWDDVVFDIVCCEFNFMLFLNMEVLEVEVIGFDDVCWVWLVMGWIMGFEICIVFCGLLFFDCMGDGLVGWFVGVRYCLGKESYVEFGEEWVLEELVWEFFGLMFFFYMKDFGYLVKYVVLESVKDILIILIFFLCIICSGDSGVYYWWIEWGGMFDIVDDNEVICDELWLVIFGIWDYIKNFGEFDVDNFMLEWIGNILGKCEYCCFIGDYMLWQQDILEQMFFDDGVVFGGWFIDLYLVEGMYVIGVGVVQCFLDGIFEILFCLLYFVNVDNLLMVGCDILVMYIVFGVVRVMVICVVMGEVVGIVVVFCYEYDVILCELYWYYCVELWQMLLCVDVLFVGVVNEDYFDYVCFVIVIVLSMLCMIGILVSIEVDVILYVFVEDLGIVVFVYLCFDIIEFLFSVEVDMQVMVEVWFMG